MKVEASLPVFQGVQKAQVQKTQNIDGEFKNALDKALQNKDKTELKEVCKQFESLFISMMYKQMRATVPKSDFLPESFAQQTFQSMLDDEFAKKASETQGIGLADMLYKQLSQRLEEIHGSSAQHYIARQQTVKGVTK